MSTKATRPFVQVSSLQKDAVDSLECALTSASEIHGVPSIYSEHGDGEDDWTLMPEVDAARMVALYGCEAEPVIDMVDVVKIEKSAFELIAEEYPLAVIFLETAATNWIVAGHIDEKTWNDIIKIVSDPIKEKAVQREFKVEKFIPKHLPEKDIVEKGMHMPFRQVIAR